MTVTGKFRKRFLRKSKVGMPPGMLVEETRGVAPAPVANDRFSLIEFSEQHYEERETKDLDALKTPVPKGCVRWASVTGLTNLAFIQKFGETLGLHPLAIEDIATPDQRPRVEDYGTYMHIILRVLHNPDKADALMDSEQVSILLGAFGVVTFHETSAAAVKPIIERLKGATGRIRSFNADYLTYRIVDAIIDSYFVVLEDLSLHIDTIQDTVLDDTDTDFLNALHVMRRNIVFLKKTLWPVRSVVSGMRHSEGALFGKFTLTFLRDVAEHAEQLIETVSAMDDNVSNAQDVYLNSASIRMNKTMRLLTVISTFFIPLTFIVGVYGMNFRKMPELDWEYGYITVWVVMIATSAWLAVYFKKRDWF